MSRFTRKRFGEPLFGEKRFDARRFGEGAGVGGGPGAPPLQAFTLFEAGALTPNTLNASTLAMQMDTSALAGGVPTFAVTHFRLTVQGTLDRCFIGIFVSSTFTEFDSLELVQVFFGGNPGVSQDNASTTVSDLVALPWNKTDDLAICTDYAAGDHPYINGTNADLFGYFGAYGTADEEAKTGQFFGGQQIAHIKKIEAIG